MNRILKHKHTLVLLFVLFVQGVGYAQPEKDIGINPDIELLPVQYIWLKTGNPVALYDVQEEQMLVNAGYQHQTGNFRDITDAGSRNSVTVFAEGYQPINNIHLYGKVGYEVVRLKEQKWNDVLFVSSNNPYALGDSIGGDFDNEIFYVKGGVASSSSDGKWQWGLGLDYKAGNSANDKDPRPLIRSLVYQVKPGILYRLGSLELGANLLYERHKEEIKISMLETTISYSFFLFKGLGDYFKRTASVGYQRRYKGNKFGGSIQFLAGNNSAVTNIVQLGYSGQKEMAEDGAEADPFKAGDYNEDCYSFADIVSLKRSRFTHSFALKGGYAKGNGTWYDQKKIVNDNSQTLWEVYNQSVNYISKQTQIGVEYDLIRTKADKPDYTLAARIAFNQNTETLYPDLQNRKYANVYSFVSGDKRFFFPRSFSLKLGANAGYRRNLSEKVQLSGLELEELFTLPRTEYMTADFFTGGVAAQISKQYQSGFYFLKAGVNYIKPSDNSVYHNDYNRLQVDTSIGFIF